MQRVKTKAEVDRDQAQAEICLLAKQRALRTGKRLDTCFSEIHRDFPGLSDVARGRAELLPGETVAELAAGQVAREVARLRLEAAPMVPERPRSIHVAASQSHSTRRAYTSGQGMW